MPHKLFHLARESFALPVLSNPATREVETTVAGHMPALFWPDGHWCLPANIYMLHLYERGLSRRGVGGTLAAYAANISHLIRFCFDRGIDIHELSDGQFTSFIAELREATRTPDGSRIRDDNTVLAIGRNCLELIACVASFRHDPGLIGREGRVRGYQVDASHRRRGRYGRATDIVSTSWHHNCFPTGDPQRRRFPITSDAIKRLEDAVASASSSLYLRRRRYAMLRVLEITGGRRMEVALLKVSDVIAALEPPNELKLFTAKRPGGKEHYRYVPVPKTDLVALNDFIKVSRRPVIRRTLGAANDHGYVFANERTGEPLRPNTITQEVHLLAGRAELFGVTCPHMFRHRYITKIFVALIAQHDLENKDDFRRALLDTNNLLRKLLQWTGHLNVESLYRYVDLAFDEIAGFKSSVSELRYSMELEAIRTAMRQLARQLDADHIPGGGAELDALSSALDEILRRHPKALVRSVA